MAKEDRTDRFVSGQGDLTQPLCNFCLRDNQDGTCSAYPDGIPKQILIGKIDHRKPYKGDHGLQFIVDSDRKEDFDKYIKGHEFK